MHPTIEFTCIFYLSIAIVLDVCANVLIKLSDGFQHKILTFVAIIFVLAAFTALSIAIEGIQLSVAYGVWGGLGLIATALLGIVMFGERLRLSGWVGMLLVIGGVLLMRFEHLFWIAR